MQIHQRLKRSRVQDNTKYMKTIVKLSLYLDTAEMQGRVHRTRGEVFAEQAIQRGPRKVLLDRRRCHQRSGQYN